MSDVVLHAPLDGWVARLDTVPDPVFAGGMMGDGLAIEPLAGELVAPCDAVVVAIAPTRHAVTLCLDGGAELLIHFGIDTVALGGEGFAALVEANERVRAGQPLLRADLDLVVRRATSAITPIILLGEGHAIVPLALDRRVTTGEPIARVSRIAGEGAATASPDADQTILSVRVPMLNGIHARPAARIAAALKPFAAPVTISHANARSVTALLAAAIERGDEVLIAGRGRDAQAAVAAVAALIESGMDEHERDASAAPSSPAPMRSGEGVTAAPGFAVGPVHRLRAVDAEVPETGEGAQVEWAALDRARQQASAAAGAGDIAEAHRALLDDPDLLGAAGRLIADGRSAGHAWRAACRAEAERLRRSGRALLAERAADLLDLERQVIAAIAGGAPIFPVPPAGAIVIAEELLPSQVPALVAAGAAGFCTAGGGPTSHAAILAASAGVPMVVAAGRGVLDLPDGRVVVLDADRARIEPQPTPERVEAARAEAADRARVRAADVAAARILCRTADGVRIEVAANLAGADDAAAAVALGAEGCGLLRTEFLFMDRAAAPGEDEQAAAYAAVAAALDGRPLVLRVLDVGGDKPLPY
ncbi:glucose PTS transporter subunit IIA, partial [Sphingomonas sp.]|uniref:glucose PTS transporter subunit IIA n=1 Tax=Sphingomonas sp. TaxID=28214 RepID=UPI0035BBB3DA